MHPSKGMNAPEVWLVNDDPAQLLVQKRLLGRFAATVWEFRSPTELIAQARKYGSCPNLVSDIHMPGMNGLELARLWCEMHPNARILLTSASSLSAREREEATFLPGNHVKLLTNFRIPELLSAAQEWFGGEAPPEDSQEMESPTQLQFFDSEVHSKLRMLGGAAFLKKALQRFAERVPTRLEACREATELGDFVRVHREAHSLKGSCGVVGASKMLDLADQLETAAQDERPSETLLTMIDGVDHLWQEAKAELQHLQEALGVQE